MMKPYPTYRQREVLQFLISGDWMPLLKLIAVGDRLLGNLIQAGWIERSPDVKTGDLYRIQDLKMPGTCSRRSLGVLSKTLDALPTNN